MSHTSTSVERTDPVSYQERQFYRCPSWCVRTDHPAEVVTFANPPIHYGPEFGDFWAQARNDEPIYVVAGAEAKDITDPDALRKIASDAIAAAEWLDAHQRGDA